MTICNSYLDFNTVSCLDRDSWTTNLILQQFTRGCPRCNCGKPVIVSQRHRKRNYLHPLESWISKSRDKCRLQLPALNHNISFAFYKSVSTWSFNNLFNFRAKIWYTWLDTPSKISKNNSKINLIRVGKYFIQTFTFSIILHGVNDDWHVHMLGQ